MRVPANQQTGTTGATEVTARFERLGWGVADNSRHDVGTDLLASARDARGVDLGLIVGIQVKTGREGAADGKYFSEPETGPSTDEATGWWFRDTDRRHIDAWLSHALPHLLVLHDLNKSISYWVHVTKDRVVSTGRGAKILVPRAQTIDFGHREDLLAVAATQRPRVEWEGSFWRGAQSLAPADALRHALIVPRLIAPHPNLPWSAPLGPEQAISLVVRARIADLGHRLEVSPLGGDLDQALDRDGWRWRFARAMHHRVTTGGAERLLALLDDCPGPAERAAATVVAAATLIEEGLAERADRLLHAALERDEAGPIDHAWLALQHARCLSDLGRIDDAREYALVAQQARATFPDDLTASAIGGQGAVALFQLTRWGEGDVAGGVSGGDTTANWWRSLTTSEGLTASANQAFKRWGRDTAITIGGRDGANDDLVAASLMASYLGSHDAWRHLSGLRARELLMRMNRSTEPHEARDALNDLRLAGDHKGMKLAATRLVLDGPADAAAQVAAGVDLEVLTGTTARTSLMLLRRAGDVLDTDTAERTCSWLLDTFTAPSAFFSRTELSRNFDVELIDTLAAIAPVVSIGTQARVADYVAGMPARPHHEPATQSWATLMRALSVSAWSAEAINRLRTTASEHHEYMRAAAYGVIAEHDATGREDLLPLIDEGSQTALSAFGDVRELPDTTVRSYVAKLADRCEQVRERAKGHSRAGGGDDAVRDLALLNAWHPDCAQWEPLLEVLEDPIVWPEDKNDSLGLLSQLADRLPGSVRDRLRPIADQLVDVKPFPYAGVFGGSRHCHGPALALARALADPADPVSLDRYRQLLALMGGDRDDRRWAARIAGATDDTSMAGLLASLVRDDSPSVRAIAASSLLRHATQGPSESLARAALDEALRDPGTLVARSLVSALHPRADEPVSDTEVELLRRLRAHRSFDVRARAERALAFAGAVTDV